METGPDRRVALAMAVVALLAFLAAVAGIDARATYGARVTADEPQYLITAISLGEDFSLDVSDELDEERFLRVPMLVLVGEQDVDRDESFRTSKRLDRHQGRTRVERALRFVDTMRARAGSLGITARHELCVVEGVGHHFRENVRAGMAERVFRFFFGNSIVAGSRAADVRSEAPRS